MSVEKKRKKPISRFRVTFWNSPRSATRHRWSQSIIFMMIYRTPNSVASPVRLSFTIIEIRSLTCGVASQVDEFIGPVALLDPVVVGQTRFAGQRVRRAVFAFHVVGAASRTVREQTELVLAPGGTDRRNCERKTT